jgi:hypothetical protein
MSLCLGDYLGDALRNTTIDFKGLGDSLVLGDILKIQESAKIILKPIQKRGIPQYDLSRFFRSRKKWIWGI